MNITSTFTLSYPETSGFDKTDIHFYKGEIDLPSLFFSTESNLSRLFVTDTTIASLPSMQAFCKYFEAEDIKALSVYKKNNDILLILGPGEAYKTMQSVLSIVKTALEANFTRNCLFIAIGGGVICDMTAFAASIFKRGVAVDFVPTTLLSMVDAAIGGKTGCDYEGFKNMVGSFWPAANLSVCSNFVLSLSAKEYISGLAEAIKTAFLFSEELLLLFKNENVAIMNRDAKILSKIIEICAKAKAAIVQEDPREKGRRAFLNLGHTFGHALEAVAGLGKISHGEAVAWGMSRAWDLSYNLGLCTLDFAEESKNILKTYGYDISARPVVLKEKGDSALPLLMEAMKKDKKNKSPDKIRMIVQKGLCQTLIQEVENNYIEEVLK